MRRFTTQTDTEVVAQLLAKYTREGLSHRDAMLTMLNRVTGAFALVVMFQDERARCCRAVRSTACGRSWTRRDVPRFGCDCALSPFTNEITYLVDGDCAIITASGAEIIDFSGNPVQRQRQISQATAYVVDKGNHRHFMEKEIYEQPEVISHALSHYVDFADKRVKDIDPAIDFSKLTGLAISACGTAYLSGPDRKYWFERYARLPVEIDVASEFRYREMPLLPTQAALFISQSGRLRIPCPRCVIARRTI